MLVNPKSWHLESAFSTLLVERRTNSWAGVRWSSAQSGAITPKEFLKRNLFWCTKDSCHLKLIPLQGKTPRIQMQYGRFWQGKVESRWNESPNTLLISLASRNVPFRSASAADGLPVSDVVNNVYVWGAMKKASWHRTRAVRGKLWSQRAYPSAGTHRLSVLVLDAQAIYGAMYQAIEPEDLYPGPKNLAYRLETLICVCQECF